MLHRTVNFIKIFLNILMDTPDQSMYHLALFPWTGWLYANIVACRIVFLQDNEHLCHYIPSEYHTVPLEENHAGPADATAVNWDPGVIAQESGIQDLFERLVDKLKFTFPPGGTTIDVDRDDRDVLFSFACIQRSILNSFSKRIREYASRPGTAPPDPSPPVNPVSTLIPNVDAAQVTPSSTQINAGPGPQPSAPQVPITPQQEYLRQQMASHTIPFIENMNFGGLNFESVQDQPTGSEPMQGVTAGKEYDDWVWNMMMDDFTLMPL
jgi:hypothetical protein